MPDRRRPAGPGRSRAARGRLAVACALLAAAGLALGAGANASVPRGDPAARLPEGALAGESWDLVARFESGHLLLASFFLTNTGLGGRTAVAVGQIVEPDGTSHAFSRSERPGGWRLDGEGRRLDLGSIVLDQREETRRFVVDKNEIGIALAIESPGAPAWPAADVAPGCGIDLLAVAGPASGSFRAPGSERSVPLRGLAALTHRWTPGLEVDCLHRGVELFAMEAGVGLYLRESETPGGERHAWLLVQRDGRTVFQGVPDEVDVTWRLGTPGYPEPARLRFAAPGVRGRVEFGESLGSFEPLARLPAPLRVAMELRTRPRVAWSAPRFQLELGGRALRGGGLAKLAWTNPSDPALPAAPAPAAGEE
jgi:hypothetical protein